MSQHNSFRKAGGGRVKKRSVLKRYERIELLASRKLWKEGDSVLCLPKTKPSV